MTFAKRPPDVGEDRSETASEGVVVRACDGESDEVSEEESEEEERTNKWSLEDEEYVAIFKDRNFSQRRRTIAEQKPRETAS